MLQIIFLVIGLCIIVLTLSFVFKRYARTILWSSAIALFAGTLLLVGKMRASDLNLLSNNVTEYEEIKLGVDQRDSFILVVGENGETNKIKLGELVKGKLQAVDKITEDIPDGDFVFKKMEDK